MSKHGMWRCSSLTVGLMLAAAFGVVGLSPSPAAAALSLASEDSPARRLSPGKPASTRRGVSPGALPNSSSNLPATTGLTQSAAPQGRALNALGSPAAARRAPLGLSAPRGGLGARYSPYEDGDVAPARRAPSLPTGPHARWSATQESRQQPAAYSEARPAITQGFGNRLKRQNLGIARAPQRPVKDAVGNPVPKGAQLVRMDRVPHLRPGFLSLQRRLGDPGFTYVMTPRGPADYWEGYWDGLRDGYLAAAEYHRHRAVVVHLFYGYYFSDPSWAGFYHPGYYPSIYHYLGWCPGWIDPSRVYYAEVMAAAMRATPYQRHYASRQVDEEGARQAIADIRQAWLDRDVDLLDRHLGEAQDIEVYFDMEYAYSTHAQDYYGMTADAMATAQTTTMDLRDPVWLSPQEVIWTGSHVLSDPESQAQSVYVSYRLRKSEGRWCIAAVGSSLEPIEHGYTDFRYQ